MNKPRRHVRETLELDSKIESFIKQGVAESGDTEKASQQSQNSEKGKPNSANENSHPQISRKRNSKANIRFSQSTKNAKWADAAYSKATIQKTVRFNPHLIARWENFVESKRAAGESPSSFQQAQNEAFQLWLQSKNA